MDNIRIIMAATPTADNQEKKSILEFEFNWKVYPGVTITDSENINMTWDEKEKGALTGFQITIKDFTAEKIADAKEQTAPRLANILGSISGEPVSYKPPKIKYIRNGKVTYGVGNTVTARWCRPISIQNIDISKVSSLLNDYSKLYMQLGHAHNGHRAFLNKDYPQAIREYFLIFEYSGRPEETKYRNLRHAVSHAKLDNSLARDDLKNNFGIILQIEEELDVNDPKIKEILYEHTRQFRHSVGLYLQEELKKELAKN
jgi:hypothetical protein